MGFASGFSKIGDLLEDVFLGNQDISVEDIPNFPIDIYQSNLARYKETRRWFTGEALDEQRTAAKGKKVDVYPLKLNPFKSTILRHVAVLFGEISEDGRPLVSTRFIPYNKNKASKESALMAEAILNLVYFENNYRSLQLEAGIMAQIFGGVAQKYSWKPRDTFRTIPIKIENLHPMNFVAIPESGNNIFLDETWIVKRVTPHYAKKFGINVSDDQAPLYVEHWTKDIVEYTINGKHMMAKTAGGETKKFSGKNPYGFIPIVYYPTVRTKGYYGDTIIESNTGLVKEMNLRLADFGDAVSEDSHSYLAVKNVNGTPKLVRVADGLEVLDLGNASSLSGNGDPDIKEVKKAAASQPMATLNEELYKQYRRGAHIPAVADGEDEGSQRSALTLAFRMWPLTSYLQLQRINWTDCLNVQAKMILNMMMLKKEHLNLPDGMEVKKEHLSMRTRQDWAPMLPRDRESIVNELVSRAGVNLGSMEHLLDLTGDIEDPVEEIEKIKKWLEFTEKLGSQPSPDEGNGSSDDEPNKDEVKKKDKNQVTQEAQKKSK